MAGNDRLLGAVSICRRAGKLAIGFDAARKALEGGAPLAVAASDAAERTLRGIKRACGAHAALVQLPRTQDEIERITGRRFAVAAVCDDNFARLIQLNIKEEAT